MPSKKASVCKMSHMRYTRVNINGRRSSSSSWHGNGNSSKGFRVCSKRFSVQGLRARFVYLFRLLSRWRFSYGQALKSLKKGSSIIKRNNSSSRKGLAMDQQRPQAHRRYSGSADYRFRSSFGRSNSFYAEAIADCLEFIKRSSISVDQKSVSICQR